jgi:anti-sigma factor RsiW
MHYDLNTIDDYLHGELDEASDAALLAHLETCAACRSTHDEAARVREWVKAAAAAEEREFPSLVKARVWEVVRSSPPRRNWLLDGWRPWLAVPVAAVVAVAVFVGHPGTHAGAAGIAASDLLLEHAAGMAGNPLADHGYAVRASVVEDGGAVPVVEAVDTTDGGR